MSIARPPADLSSPPPQWFKTKMVCYTAAPFVIWRFRGGRARNVPQTCAVGPRADGARLRGDGARGPAAHVCGATAPVCGATAPAGPRRTFAGRRRPFTGRDTREPVWARLVAETSAGAEMGPFGGRNARRAEMGQDKTKQNKTRQDKTR
jgi:hypothetical protein